jgi:hypothetical protein
MDKNAVEATVAQHACMDLNRGTSTEEVGALTTVSEEIAMYSRGPPLVLKRYNIPVIKLAVPRHCEIVPNRKSATLLESTGQGFCPERLDFLQVVFKIIDLKKHYCMHKPYKLERISIPILDPLYCGRNTSLKYMTYTFW